MRKFSGKTASTARQNAQQKRARDAPFSKFHKRRIRGKF
jgi:hypothetical protein